MNWIILAEALPDPTAGWTGPAAYTAAGLLAFVLGWLMFFHLPSKDKQIKEAMSEFHSVLDGLSAKYVVLSEAELARRATQQDQQRTDFAALLKTTQDGFLTELRESRLSFIAELRVEREQCQARHTEIMAGLKETRHAVKNLAANFESMANVFFDRQDAERRVKEAKQAQP